MEPSDRSRELLERCQRGDQAALADFVRQFQQSVFRLARTVCGDPALAEEVVVETFYKVWTRCGSFRKAARVETWLYRITVRTTLDLQRSRRRWWNRVSRAAEQAPTEASVDDSPERALVDQEERQQRGRRLHVGLNALKEADRVLLSLYYLQEMNLTEIAEVMDVPQARLKMRLSRARNRLRSVLADGDPVQEEETA